MLGKDSNVGLTSQSMQRRNQTIQKFNFSDLQFFLNGSRCTKTMKTMKNILYV